MMLHWQIPYKEVSAAEVIFPNMHTNAMYFRKPLESVCMHVGGVGGVVILLQST